MKRFKNILLVYNGREDETTAVDRAASLAQKNQARVTVVAVEREPPSEQRLTSGQGAAQELYERLLEARRRSVEAMATSLRDQGVNADAELLVGPAFLQIIRRVLRVEHDLVIITAEGRTGLKERLLGSTSMHLLRKCPCAVWVIKPTVTRPYSRILTAVDPDASSPTKLALSHKLLTLATSLAQSDESELHVVHVWDLYGESLLRRDIGVELDKLREEARRGAEAQLTRALEDVDLNEGSAHLHLEKGDPALVISGLVQELAPDIVVMGTVGRTGLAGFLIGNTAESVLSSVDSSVLTIKPDGFQTPVTV